MIGNGTYTSLPPLPGCLLSAHAVSAALRNAGFTVVEHEDATSGATDAAIGEASRGLTAAPGATAFVYVCGYATALNERTFLLPTSANIARPTDALTQGVLARSLLEMLSRGGAGSAVVALDVVPAPGAPAALGLDAALQGTLPDGLGSIAVTQATPPDGPTPLAAALVANLKPATVQIGPLLRAVQQQLCCQQGGDCRGHPFAAGQPYLVGGPALAPAAPAPLAHAAAPAGAARAGAARTACGSSRRLAARPGGGAAGTGRRTAVGHGGRPAGRRADDRRRSAPRANGAGAAGLLRRPGRRHFRARHARRDPSLPARTARQDDRRADGGTGDQAGRRHVSEMAASKREDAEWV